MGMVSLSLESKTVPEYRYFTVTNDGTSDEEDYFDLGGSQNVKASANFSNVSHYYVKGTDEYCRIVNPRFGIVATSSETGANKWLESSITLNAQSNKYVSYTANCRNYIYRGWLYSYRGKGQAFTPPTNGSYRIECWGAGNYFYALASSGTYSHISGGGYTKGEISLTISRTLYIFCGRASINSETSVFNGGGGSGTSSRKGIDAGYTNTSVVGPSGCGATDVRLDISNDATEWNNFQSLLSRIMVAGGAAYATTDAYYSVQGAAGGLTGYDSYAYNYRDKGVWGGKGASQTEGGDITSGTGYGGVNGTVGFFGCGGWGGTSRNSSAAGGGGGGYYGGGGGPGANTGSFSGGGGSSYVSGHAGCNSVSSLANGATSSDRKHRGVGTIHYSGLSFSNIRMIDGGGYLWPANSNSKGSQVQQPCPTSSDTQYGHNGNGYCRITELFME